MSQNQNGKSINFSSQTSFQEISIELTPPPASIRLADAPENSIILLEDIDAAFGSREVDLQMETAYQVEYKR